MGAVARLVFLIGATFAAAALSPAQAEPYREVLDACREAPKDPGRISALLVAFGWRDVTSTETFSTFILETMNQQARARLSAVSYPEPWWTDEAVRGSYPSTEATSLRDLEQKIERSVAQLHLSDMPASKVLHVGSDRNAWAVIYAYDAGQFVQCWLVAMAAENPTLSGDFRSNSRIAVRGYTVNSWPVEGLRASVTILSNHAHQGDTPFPVRFDLSLAVAVQKAAP